MIKDNLANSVQQRSRADSTPNQTTLKQRPGRDHRTSTGQEMLEGIKLTSQIERATEESQTKNWDAKRQ